MADIIQFPKKFKEPNNASEMKAFIKNYVIDLTEIRKGLIRMEKELNRQEKRVRLRLVKNEKLRTESNT